MKAAPTAEKISPGIIDVVATHVKTLTTKNSEESTDAEATSPGDEGSAVDDSAVFVFPPSDRLQEAQVRHHPHGAPLPPRPLGPPVAGAAEAREWYFFVPRDGGRRHQQQHAGGSGGRPSRTTERGFWKATGSDRAVRCAADPKRLIGLKKTLVYYNGRAPRGTKTDWVMNEYRLPPGEDAAGEGVVLCKVYRKAVSLKELEQRVAMEELARAGSTSHNSSAGSPGDSSSGAVSSSSDHQTMMAPAVPCMMKKEETADASAAVARPAAMMSLPQLEVARPPQQVAEWMQDPFLTQLRSPWMESWSPYYPSSVLNF
ncbi:hypothetical protein EJB05_46552, partial [Eragrostis curvula]